MAEAVSVELIERRGRWLVPMAGLTVTQCRVDYAFTMLVDDGYEVRIEQPFTLVRGAASSLLDPEGEPSELGPALSVLRRDVEQAVAFKDGRLEIALSDGVRVLVNGDDDHEPWTVVGPGGLRVVSMPGGELAIWKPDPGGG